MAIFVLVSGFGFLAISVWGWGSCIGYFSNPARLAAAFVMLGLCIAALFSDSSGLGSGVREDKSNRWVLVPLIIISLFFTWFQPYLDRRNEWVWGGDLVRWIGVALCLMGGTLRIAPVFALGHRFSGLVAIQEGHTLKTDGLYRIIRHPSYLGMLMTSLGWSLVFRCLVPGLILAAAIFLILIARMNSEENLLGEQFGDEYAAYKKRTWRLIPWVY